MKLNLKSLFKKATTYTLTDLVYLERRLEEEIDTMPADDADGLGILDDLQLIAQKRRLLELQIIEKIKTRN